MEKEMEREMEREREKTLRRASRTPTCFFFHGMTVWNTCGT